jgi:hypothetical protein
MNAAELITELTESFNEVPYPGEFDIVYNNSDYDLEVKRIRETFKAYTWQLLPNEVMHYDQGGYIFLSKKGLKYYLPAYLRFAVRDYAGADSIPDSLVFFLTLPTEIDVVAAAITAKRYQNQMIEGTSTVDLNEEYQARLRDTNDRVHRFIDRNSQFSLAQSRAILHFLEYMRDEHSEDFFNNEPAVAIERYWFQFKQSSS